ncbi:MAG: aminoacyl-tRNA hydrolase [Erysipelotrichaceae bacterium]|uniref:Peptidyl-tRNA hydrolase n=1 Tax=Copranaerobaculum intestinale TaxID=2692629 RepID=A0A6N8U7X7_9FIRM|nr:aminoacyl-tRNA hydrolase [Copranaerobaculum intestinale]MBS6374237.1 aminoacyl-tRNA hydrolase [Erysipelotrichaceae bacterium]MXQ72649.1 aminoacyl-tRNA hydrolase [Copranaerobaculum intestinale]
MKLIVGLGNPGKQYEKTRHNTGFMVMDELASSLHCPIDQKKFKALIGQTMVQGEKILLMKPQTYMNLSGEAVYEAMKFYQLTADDILVIYDDLDLPVGKLRLREQGSAGGQNGIKNIIAHLHTQDFKRIRVGIGNDKLMLTADYVLGKIPKSDRELHQDAVKRAAQAAEASIIKPFSDVMGLYNRK